jgi:hypothetical protein
MQRKELPLKIARLINPSLRTSSWLLLPHTGCSKGPSKTTRPLRSSST